MTSSLPNLPAAPAPAGAAPANSASLADRGEAGCPAAGDFADLMATADADAFGEIPVTATALPGFTILAPTLISLLGAAPAETVESAAAVPAAGATDESALPAGISRDTMEQAASLLATILQSVLPEATAAAPVASSGSADAVPTTTARRDAGPPVGEILAGTPPGGPGSTDQAALATETAAVPEAGPAVPPYQFEAALAADGAVEINATLPPPKEQGSAEKSPAGIKSSAAAGNTDDAMQIQAELTLPGRAVIRLSASGSPDDALHGRANFAGRISVGKITPHSADSTPERNFLNTGEKELKTVSPADGITVAKTEITMNNAPTETTRATSNPDTSLGLPARGEFTVAWPSAVRASEPAVAPLEQNFAERAVATVTNLVDTQFTASMQKSGSVQLRLKFGGEDLSVRVELRGGEVHTDFRTDSAELRAALNREWQTVAGQSSDALRRFVEPVFSPSSSNGGDSSSFARQQAAQQDLPQQRQARSRDEDTLTFTRRSLVGETFTPPPAASRAPALLPTSLRLSVLA